MGPQRSGKPCRVMEIRLGKWGKTMKASERKIKQEMPFENLPSYLRQLAHALEKQTDGLPAELADLPEPIVKLEVRGKARDNGWEIKIKIKAEPPENPEAECSGAHGEENAAPAAQPEVNYKSLKKRLKSSFRDIGESLAAQKLPEPAIMNAFLSDSGLMMSFPGEKYGESCYSAYREACRRLAEAFEAKRWEAFKAACADIDQLKKDCHAAFK
jgi:XXXCH domain-containing protein